VKKVAKTILATIWRLGKGTATVLGLAMLLALVAGLASTAFAFVPGDPLELGRLNPINRITQVVGNTNDALLRISNGSTGDSATVLKLRVRAGKAPMTVSAHAGKAINPNADKVDGMGASAFFSGNTYKVQDGRIGPGEGRMAFRLVSCDEGDAMLNGGGGCSVADGDDLRFSSSSGSDGWTVSVVDNNNPSGVVAEVICADFPPLR
jgi:hypothetical protein